MSRLVLERENIAKFGIVEVKIGWSVVPTANCAEKRRVGRKTLSGYQDFKKIDKTTALISLH